MLIEIDEHPIWVFHLNFNPEPSLKDFLINFLIFELADQIPRLFFHPQLIILVHRNREFDTQDILDLARPHLHFLQSIFYKGKLFFRFVILYPRVFILFQRWVILLSHLGKQPPGLFPFTFYRIKFILNNFDSIVEFFSHIGLLILELGYSFL